MFCQGKNYQLLDGRMMIIIFQCFFFNLLKEHHTYQHLVAPECNSQFPLSLYIITAINGCYHNHSSDPNKTHLSPNYHKHATSQLCYYVTHVSIQYQNISDYIPLSFTLAIVCSAKKKILNRQRLPQRSRLSRQAARSSLPLPFFLFSFSTHK